VTRREQLRRVEQLLDKQEHSISSAFLESIEELRGNISLSEILRELERGNFNLAITLLDEQRIAQSLVPFSNKINQAVIAGGAFASAVGASFKVVVNFDAFNPSAAQWVQDYKLSLITAISENTRRGIQQRLFAGINAGDNPLTIARNIKQGLGLTYDQMKTVERYRGALENLDRYALSLALRDRRFDRTVLAAIAEQRSLSSKQIDRMVAGMTRKKLRHRAETIARTEAIRAVNAGKHLAFLQAVESGVVEEERIRRFWMHSHDSKVRDSHLAIPEMNPDGVGLEEPFQSPLGNILFPGDPAATPGNSVNCRCAVEIRIEPKSSS
jgi:hypothetical protein